MVAKFKSGRGSIPIGGITQLFPEGPAIVDLDGQLFIKSEFYITEGYAPSLSPIYTEATNWSTNNTDALPTQPITSTNYKTSCIGRGDNGTLVVGASFWNANGGAIVFVSTDNGATWLSRSIGWTEGTLTTLQDVATDGSGNWVVVGTLGQVSTSANDGTSWTLRASVGSTFNAVTTNKTGAWVGVGNSFIATSTNNGSNWTTRTAPSAVYFDVETDGAGVWIAVGNNGVISRSTDNGVTWTAVTSGTSASVVRVATDGAGVWVAVGSFGYLRSADNGLTWSLISSTTQQNVIHYNANSGIWVSTNARSLDNGFTWDTGISTSKSNGTRMVSNANGVYLQANDQANFPSLSTASRRLGFSIPSTNISSQLAKSFYMRFL